MDNRRWRGAALGSCRRRARRYHREVRLTLFAFIAAALHAGELRLGRAEVKITPPEGMPMGGGFTVRPGKAAHDDLFCKALVFEQDGTRAGLVSCDVESFHRPWIVKARRLITDAGGVPGDNVMITATHSHSGPEMTPIVLAGAAGETKRIADAYHEALPGRIAEAVRLAGQGMEPARVWFGRGSEDSVSFNRRYVMKDGSVKTNPGQVNPDIVRVAGPIDPELLALYFDTPEGKPLATIVNFALHTTSWGGADFSSDYPGIVARRLAEVKGADMTTLFLPGCSGNINQVDVTTKERQSGPAVSARIGNILAADVMKLYRKMEPVPAAALRIRSRAVELAPLSFTGAELAAAKRTIEASRKGGAGGPKYHDIVHAFTGVTATETHGGKPVRTETQAIAFGEELAIAGLPAEVFTELGMALKRGSPYPRTLVSELANDMLDYIPNLRAFPEGSYEPTTARCAPGCGEHLIQEATSLLVELFREGMRK